MLLSEIITFGWISSSCHPVDSDPGFLINFTGHIFVELLTFIFGSYKVSFNLPVLVHANIVEWESMSECLDWKIEHAIIRINKVDFLSIFWSPSAIKITPSSFVSFHCPRISHFQEIPLLSTMSKCNCV